MAKPKLPKSTIECPDCKRASGFPLGDAKGFSRRRFLQVGATGLVASYFLDVLNPRLLGATRAPNVYMRNSASNAIFIFLAGAPSNIDTWDLKEGAWTPSDFAPASFAAVPARTSAENSRTSRPPEFRAQRARLGGCASARAGVGADCSESGRRNGIDRASHRIGRIARRAGGAKNRRRSAGLHRAQLSRHSAIWILPRDIRAISGRAGSDRSADDQSSGWRCAIQRPLELSAPAR